jgi:hypothetical protein
MAYVVTVELELLTRRYRLRKSPRLVSVVTFRVVFAPLIL